MSPEEPRSRQMGCRLKGFELPPGADPMAVECAFGEGLLQVLPPALGVQVDPRVEILAQVQGSMLLMPPPDACFVDGRPVGDSGVPSYRSLRSDDLPAYEAALLDLAQRLGLGDARCHLEYMVRFEWGSFKTDTWTAFDQACVRLPGWIGKLEGLPWWFGRDEGVGPSLSGGVEPPGLHLVGVLGKTTFEDWLSQFLQLTDSLPG
jgi:hypothetical protein